MAKYLARSCPKCNGYWDRGPRTEGQDDGGGGQWTVREMRVIWLRRQGKRSVEL